MPRKRRKKKEKKFEKLKIGNRSPGEIFKFSPEVYGVGVNLKELWHWATKSRKNKDVSEKSTLWESLGMMVKQIIIGILVLAAGNLIYQWVYDGFYIGQRIENIGTANKKMIPTQETAQLSSINFSLQGYQIDDISTTTEMLLDSIRIKHGVRQLLLLESGLPLNELPALTYFFMSGVYLRVAPTEDFSVILQREVDRLNPYNSYFELHKISENVIYLLGFASEESYIRATKNGSSLKTLTIFSRAVSGFDYLVVTPIQMIAESNYRDISFDDGSTVKVLDIKIQEK